MADIHPIRTETDYDHALAEIATLMEKDPALDTPEGERLELLSKMYEAKKSQPEEEEPEDESDKDQE